jgi:single-strand DNA-binding protein
MNKLMVVGRLTKQPELRGNENSICVFTVAVNRPYTNQQGTREADFIQVKTFKKLAENCSKFLKKGSRVSVVASIRTGSFQKDGKTVFTMEVIADDVGFLDGKSDSGNNSTNNGANHNQNSRNQRDDDPFPGGTDYNTSGDGDWPFA